MDGGGMYLMANSSAGKPLGISVYDPVTGKFAKHPGDYTEAWNKLASGSYILRVEYPDYSNTIKIIKQ